MYVFLCRWLSHAACYCMTLTIARSLCRSLSHAARYCMPLSIADRMPLAIACRSPCMPLAIISLLLSYAVCKCEHGYVYEYFLASSSDQQDLTCDSIDMSKCEHGYEYEYFLASSSNQQSVTCDSTPPDAASPPWHARPRQTLPPSATLQSSLARRVMGCRCVRASA